MPFASTKDENEILAALQAWTSQSKDLLSQMKDMQRSLSAQEKLLKTQATTLDQLRTTIQEQNRASAGVAEVREEIKKVRMLVEKEIGRQGWKFEALNGRLAAMAETVDEVFDIVDNLPSETTGGQMADGGLAERECRLGETRKDGGSKKREAQEQTQKERKKRNKLPEIGAVHGLEASQQTPVAALSVVEGRDRADQDETTNTISHIPQISVNEDQSLTQEASPVSASPGAYHEQTPTWSAY